MTIKLHTYTDASEAVTTFAGDTYVYKFMGGDDFLTVAGQGINNWFDMGTGNDHVTLNFSGNTVFGGLGDDVITDFAKGRDDLFGGAGNDAFYILDTSLSAPSAGDHIDAGAGNDTINLQGHETDMLVHGGEGDDRILVSAQSSDIHLNLSTFTGEIYGDAGNDTFEVRAVDHAPTTVHLHGGLGDDTYLITSNWYGYTIDSANLVEQANEGNDTVYIRPELNWTLGSNIENLIVLNSDAYGTNKGVYHGNELANHMVAGQWGSEMFGHAGDDLIVGLNGADTLHGDAGNDTIYGGGGNDLISGDKNSVASEVGTDALYGGAGNDTLDGGNGDDVLSGGTGADWMNGGFGHDTYVVDDAGDHVAELNNGGETDTVQSMLATYTLEANVENLNLFAQGASTGFGNSAANVINGSAYANFIDGKGGNDIINGDAGADVLRGGDGNDTVDGGTGNDMIGGGANDDKLTGGAGTDILKGETGRDVLDGGADGDALVGGWGGDWLTGGTGADKFVFTALTDSFGTGANFDTITDFKTAYDRIDLHGIDADFDTAGDQAFHFIGDHAAMFASAGDLWAEHAGLVTNLYGDVNGDGTADFHIALQGDITLSSFDFIL